MTTINFRKIVCLDLDYKKYLEWMEWSDGNKYEWLLFKGFQQSIKSIKLRLIT